MRPRREGYCNISVPASTEYDIPHGMLSVARRRTHFLIARLLIMNFEDVLASAYMQGMHDAVDAMPNSPGQPQ